MATSESGDFWGALGNIAGNLGSYFIQQQQTKQQIKMAKAMAGMGSGLPALGMGYSAGQLQPYGSGLLGIPAGYASGAMTLPAQPSSPLGDLGSMLGLSSAAGASCSLFKAPSTGNVRAQSLVMQVNPINGRLHFWRHVGSPVEFSGDRGIVKRYLRRHGGRRRPR